MLLGASIVTEVCATGSMRTIHSLSTRDGTQTVVSLEVSFLKGVKRIVKNILLNNN